MTQDPWTNVRLHRSLAEALDTFKGQAGYSSRADVLAAAVRQFLEGAPLSRAELRKIVLAVASTQPQTVEDLLRALLAELDDEVRKPPHQDTSSKSSSESTKRL